MPSRLKHPSQRSAFAYLASRSWLGVKFGLETIRAVLESLGHPEGAYPALLVGGTNGKGSVVAYTDAALRAAGLRTGRYTSPHLVRVNERIAVDGRLVTDRELAHAVGRVRAAAEGLIRARRLKAHPTYFEVMTAAALEHFRRRRVDVAILEVGMGGRLDATNAVDPLASAIVSVDYDHQDYLGRTLERIATEKAGILRAGRTTVLGPLPVEARRAIAVRARAVGARLVDARRGVRVREKEGRLDVTTPRRNYRGLRPLRGAHQHTNLLVGLRLIEEAKTAGLALDLSRAGRGISHTRWPGRLEWVEGDPPMLLDGAHNPSGARALGAYLEDRGPYVLVFGVMADKDVRGLARELFPRAVAVVLTRPRGRRSASPRTIARIAPPLARAPYAEARPRRALALARRLAREAGPGVPVVVAGSLYLVGEVKAFLSRARWI
jgi:dihydrofolate synthase / folylpolyglutamate synthase